MTSMSVSVRKLLIASLISLHASVMVCGNCLHMFPGSEHRRANSRLENSPESSPRETGGWGHESPHDCPVCHLVSQGQMPVLIVSCSRVNHVQAMTPVDRPANPPLSTHHSSSPRAPPSLI
ncbi:MAG: hypothetical protein NVSMB9_25640 [Isosphaeraceae bacterium]